MTISEKLYEVLSPLVGGRVYFDDTPEDGPEGYPYIVVTYGGGTRAWYVEQVRPDKQHYRVSIVGATKKPKERDVLADLIEQAICDGGFPASQPYGGPISGSSPTHDEIYSQQQFGIYF